MTKMIKTKHGKYRLLILFVLLQICAVTALGQNSVSIRMNVDASDAARNVFHTTLTIPVKPGPLSLFYPKWIPGEHSPTGPINDMAGLKLSANGKSIPWKRDAVEMFAFYCEIPGGVSALEIAFDDVSQPSTTMSAPGYTRLGTGRPGWGRVDLPASGRCGFCGASWVSVKFVGTSSTRGRVSGQCYKAITTHRRGLRQKCMGGVGPQP